MKIGILGGGLSGVSLAYFLQKNRKIKNIDILERESTIGGLCRSFDWKGGYYDIGPHIIFSKDKEILDLMTNLLADNKVKLRRSNKIYYKGSFITYPFENALSELPEKEKETCLKTFLNNPYEKSGTENLHQLFLKSFGEGITNIYLKPYNEKIWKYDLSSMDTQMTDRIPMAPSEDIIKGAQGNSIDGHLHQLYFYYPSKGGIQSLINSFMNQLSDKVRIFMDNNIVALQKVESIWKVKTDKDSFEPYDLVISTIPVQILTNIYQQNIPEAVIKSVRDLKYNSIIVTIINTNTDNLGDHFAIMIPDKDIIFHRVSKLNFLGDGYGAGDDSTNLMVEITYPNHSPVGKMSNFEIERKIVEDLEKIQVIDHRRQINSMETRRFEYAYVVYDLNHKKNINLVRNYFIHQGMKLCGRFGEFEYLNMDAVIRHAKALSDDIGNNIQIMP